MARAKQLINFNFLFSNLYVGLHHYLPLLAFLEARPQTPDTA